MFELNDTILYNNLINRDNKLARYYASFFSPLEQEMGSILQYIRNVFPDYPDHGLQHSIRIIEYIGRILNKEELDDMSSLEIFILILSALFHDAGMALYNDDEKEKLRENHHCFAEKVINLYFDRNLNNLSEKDRVKDVVNFVCYAHGMTLEELKAHEKFNRITDIGFEQVRYGLLAILLRIGDLMDLEGERIGDFRMYMFGKDFSETALEHNVRHQNVKYYRYNPEGISIEVVADSIQQYKIWHDWFAYLENDILCANTFLQAKNYHFPCPNTKIVKADGAKFDVQELRFEIDEKGGIWEIISKSVYTNELDFVRELVQNAIDAILKKMYISVDEEWEYTSPRSWNVHSDDYSVLVCYSEKQRKLYVIDQGIGMNEDDLKNFLFKVSSSGTVYSAQRGFEFPGIAQYGIGFVSCLINAEEIQIFTSKAEDKNINHVTMSSNLNVAFIEKETKNREFSGTSIVLKLNRKFLSREIESYLKRIFCYPSVDVRYINLDSAEKVIENLSNREKVISLLEKPYILTSYIYEMEMKSERACNQLECKRRQLKQFEDKYNDLRFFFQSEYSSIFSKEKIKEFYRRIDGISEKFPSETLKNEFPDFMSCFSGNFTAKEEEKVFKCCIRLLDEYSLEIKSEIGKYDRKIQNNYLDIRRINLRDLSLGGEWRYLVAFFDNDFNVYNIEHSDHPIDISRKTGFILFKHSEEDFENGIEYVALNGFLFKDGQIYKQLARVSGYQEEVNRNDESFVIGLEEDDYDIKDQLEEYIEDQFYNNEDDLPMHYIDGRYVPLNRFKTEYDVINIENNQFVRTNNVEVFKTNDIFHYEYSDSEEHTNLYDDIAGEGKRKNAGDFEVNLLELKGCIDVEKNAYYQDGIAISSKLNSLFPIGFFRIVCNCTANARMKLNVTRHEVSEIRTDVEHWVNFTGHKIQSMIFNTLSKMLEFEHLYIDYNNLICKQENMDYFEQECLKSLQKIISNKV